MGKGWLTDDEVHDLMEWTFEMNVEDERLLTRFDLSIELIFFLAAKTQLNKSCLSVCPSVSKLKFFLLTSRMFQNVKYMKNVTECSGMHAE